MEKQGVRKVAVLFLRITMMT